MPGKTFPNWCFTVFDMDWNIDKIDKNIVTYLVYQREKCPESGKLHYQCYGELINKKGISGAQKAFGIGKSHLEPRRGSQEEAIAYCKKSESRCKEMEPIEFGKKKDQGSRGDLKQLVDDIKDGKITVDMITSENPEKYHQYGRTLHRVEDLKMRKNFRSEQTNGIWYFGPTGVGKSHVAFKNFSPETHYVVNTDTKWWDGYTQQEFVIINDFRGEIPYNKLLQMVDKWPFSVSRRGREDMPFTSKTVIITSSLSPEKIYKNREAEDKIEQLLRRFKIIELTTQHQHQQTIDQSHT